LERVAGDVGCGDNRPDQAGVKGVPAGTSARPIGSTTATATLTAALRPGSERSACACPSYDRLLFPAISGAPKDAEKALVMVIQEAWIGGVSTRRVDELVQALGLSGISKSQVSKLCKTSTSG